MTYGQFLKECEHSEEARILLRLWFEGKVSLYPAIEYYNKTNKQLRLL